jgi:hypothetical protein
VGTGFTYQGWIADGNQPANGLYDFQFKLFDANTAGQQIASTIEVNDVNVVDGHFAVELDFCRSQGQQGRVWLDVFGGDARWLEIGVRPALGDQGLASEPYTVLSPRRKITTSAYALHALSGGGLYDVLRWPSNWSLGSEESPKPPGDAGGQSLFNVGKLGIGTTSPACPLDVAGAANLNKDKTGIALTVNGSEALWYNGTYFSWGYGGSANFFADNVGIGTNPAERLDLSWSGGVNARIGMYDYLGSCFSSATLVLGNNVRARTDNVNGIVVGNQHETYGYRAITMSMDGIQFYGRAGTVKAGDPLDAATERMRITNDGKVGIGTTTPGAKLDIESGTGTYPSLIKLGGNVPGNVKARHYVYLGSGYGRSHGTSINYDWDSARKDVAQLSAIDFGLGAGGTGGMFPGGGFFFNYMPPAGSSWITAMHINHETGNVGIGTTAPTEKLDVDGTARLRRIAAGSGTAVVVDQNGKLWKQSSSQRYKTSIQDLRADPDKVLGLRPVRFQWTTTSQEDIGLIAEEVEGLLKDMVIYDQEGRPDAVKYDKVSLYLLQVVKDLKSENESLRQRVDALEKRMGLDP